LQHQSYHISSGGPEATLDWADNPPEHNPETIPDLRILDELRMQGRTVDKITEKLNQDGYSK
jgi:hypothetical protein